MKKDLKISIIFFISSQKMLERISLHFFSGFEVKDDNARYTGTIHEINWNYSSVGEKIKLSACCNSDEFVSK